MKLELLTITARAWGQEEGEWHRRKGREKGDMETGGGVLRKQQQGGGRDHWVWVPALAVSKCCVSVDLDDGMKRLRGKGVAEISSTGDSICGG